ncbi:heme-binding protein HmuY [Leptospira levettii]|uniref:HmuY family protein n=2 Tax=Leptospira levettii TaxID=2023178 RepID=UPI000C2B0D0C|nr:HmuY family protein [Leptospira levettii]PJZ35624.1 heme-binding protein HmuY [Leptospira levettii]PJZ88191.1 heme-binding protein HmuY [Leptospira levettii]TGM33918.1 heme-binding protein HmuY [Leptospira levettii]TGM85435.1 heme-binding protein HmuY [Leptospira levettii]
MPSKQFILKTCFFYSILLIISSFQIQCSMKPKTEDNSQALLLLLNESSTSSNCSSVPTNAVVTSGSFTTSANASSNCNWVYVSLKRNGVLSDVNSQWDLAFKRYNVATNSGTSGSGSGGACDSGQTNFSNAFNGSECTAVVDLKLSSSGGGPVSASSESINPTMAAPLDLSPMPSGYGTWYSYSNGILTARTKVFIVTGSDGAKYAVQFLDYYNAAGTSGFPKFQWKKL